MELGRPDTEYVETSRGYLGYQTYGTGDRDILFSTSAIKNLDAMWDEPSVVRFFDRLATMGRVIMFDMAGSGVSDPIRNEAQWGPVEELGDSVLAVLDAVGSDRTVLYGDTEGGFGTLSAAVQQPERFESMVIVNGLARLDRAADYPIGIPEDAQNVIARQYVEQHGTTGAMLDLTAPSVARDLRFRSWWTRYQRLSVPKGLVDVTYEWFRKVDLRHVLPSVTTPTLLIARRDARYHRLAYSEYMAEHIPHAELVVVDGADTSPFHAGDFGLVLDHVEEYITGASVEAPSQRVLKTVMFTDIVGSTSTASQLGDERWLDLLADHDRILRLELARYGGEEVKMTGDGCVAVFDRPVGAISCASAVTRMLREIGLNIRAGIHTGEIELRDGEIRGLGLHVAARIMDTADTGGVAVSRTVRDLVIGSSIVFEPSGTHQLKGVPGEWDLYCVVDQ